MMAARIRLFPAGGVDTMGQPIVHHINTTAARYAAGHKTYYSADEALRDSRQNAIYMRKHTGIRECLQRRQEATALLNWHLAPEDPESPLQRALCDRLTKIIERTSRFMELRRCLSESIWYGRYGAQLLYSLATVHGQRSRVIKGWLPVNGDKLVFQFSDGEGDSEQGAVGIRVTSTRTERDYDQAVKQYGREKIFPTERGYAYFLDANERRRFILHQHLIEDGSYDDGRQADYINGVGVRDVIYWTWMQMLDIQAWMMDFLQRSGMGVEIWKYPANNDEARKATEAAAKNRTDVSVLTVPVWPGDESAQYGIEFKEPSFSGVEAVKDLLQSYYLHQIKRYILGQTLTTEAEATGLGSGVADAHLATYSNIVRYDARNLEEALTRDLVQPLKLFNDPQSRHVHIRFVIDTEGDDAESKMAAWKEAWDMGLDLKSDDVRDLIGASKPGPDDEILESPMKQQQQFGPFNFGQPAEEPEGDPNEPGAQQEPALSPGQHGRGSWRERAANYIGELSEKFSKKHEFSSTHFVLPDKLAQMVLRRASEIADSDLVDDGREEEPHITVKYGLHTNDADDVAGVVSGVFNQPIKARLGDISVFKNDDFDVVKVEVESEGLRALHGLLRDSLENTESHPVYKPHVTLAYVKPGAGDKYVGACDVTGEEVEFDTLVFSDKKRGTTEIPLLSRDTVSHEEEGEDVSAIRYSMPRDAGEYVKELYRRGGFDESKHPRGQPENAGQFVEKGKEAKKPKEDTPSKNAEAKPKKAPATRPDKFHSANYNPETKTWTLEGGQPLPDYLKGRVYANWKDVKVSLDPNVDMLAIAVDEKGRGQKVYRRSYEDQNAAIKFARTRLLMAEQDEIQREILDDVKSGHEPAMVSWLIFETGLRPGSEKDTKGEKKAYGATNLLGKHVVVSDNGRVTLEFTGKKGVDLKIPVQDRSLAKMLASRAARVGDENQLFSVNERQLNNYNKMLGSGGYTSKEFRTRKGSWEAAQKIKGMTPPKNEKEYKAKVKEVGDHVSKLLGNTRSVALASYIDPRLFDHWKNSFDTGE